LLKNDIHINIIDIGGGFPGIHSNNNINIEEISEKIKEADMVFVTCGLGGGTGSGASPTIVEIAKKFPTVQFILCGSGDPSPFLTQPNIIYKRPIHGKERSEYLGDCVAILCLTTYLEPFGCSAVEAQLCGTPVISSDFGGMVETVEQFKTGLRGHTLSDFCIGVQMALDGFFDREYIRERAVKKYDMYNLAYDYEYVFKSVNDIHNGKNGWYSPDSHILFSIMKSFKD
jgi:hypothetical protein